DGRIWVAWIDKRDLKIARESGREYAGAAVYYAYSQNRGESWQGDFKLADHSCECCRIAFAVNTEGRVLAMWRHVFAGPERDHAAAVLDIARPPTIERATFDGWRVDACPHHGPGLAVTRDGVRHAVWFNQVRGQGRVFYGQLSSNGPAHVLELPPGASHAEIAAEGDVVGIAWKRFDGANVRLESWVSQDAGMTFASGPTLRTQGDSDQPRLVSDGRELVIVWRREEGVAVQRLLPAAAPALAEPPPQSPLRPFERDTLAHIERSHAGEAFWLVLWDMECTYCLKSLQNFAQAQRERPALKVVTVATDSISSAEALRKRLAQIGVVSEAYAFVDGPPEPIRFAIDPAWMGEKPRAYQYGPNGERESISGVISVEQLRGVRSQARLTR
ncbi:MAG TPA: hypothetical protein VHK24_04830, partial [Steroidobacter sp.]|nr:hypothetical protein [Steroidobacter sp.]